MRQASPQQDEIDGRIHPETLQAGMSSDNPTDLQLKGLFEAITGSEWDHIVGQMVYSRRTPLIEREGDMPLLRWSRLLVGSAASEDRMRSR
jgi:hypothetical protein